MTQPARLGLADGSAFRGEDQAPVGRDLPNERIALTDTDFLGRQKETAPVVGRMRRGARY